MEESISILRRLLVDKKAEAARIGGRKPEVGLEIHKAAEAIRMALDAVLATVVQPMDAAPKDRPILGWNEKGMAIIQWHSKTLIGENWYGEDCWRLVETGDFAEDDKWFPDGWLPLPIVRIPTRFKKG